MTDCPGTGLRMPELLSGRAHGTVPVHLAFLRPVLLWLSAASAARASLVLMAETQRLGRLTGVRRHLLSLTQGTLGDEPSAKVARIGGIGALGGNGG